MENNHFNKFTAALAAELDPDLSVRMATNACFEIRFSGLPHLMILYYGLEAGERMKGYLEEITTAIHIDEDTWVRKPDVLLSRLKAKAGRARKVYARDTLAARIDKRQAMEFQREHHLHVALPGKYRFGLFLEGELVSVAIFSGGRKMKSDPGEFRSFELLRFCHKKGLVVVGGLSKLLRAFETSFSPGDIMTYVDKDWSDGRQYEKLGFSIIGSTEPQEYWIDSRTLQRYTTYDLPAELASLDAETRQAHGWYPRSNNGSLKLVKSQVIFY